MPCSRWYSAVGTRLASSSPSCGRCLHVFGEGDDMHRNPDARGARPAGRIAARHPTAAPARSRSRPKSIHSSSSSFSCGQSVAVAERARRIEHARVMRDAHHSVEPAAGVAELDLRLLIVPAPAGAPGAGPHDDRAADKFGMIDGELLDDRRAQRRADEAGPARGRRCGPVRPRSLAKSSMGQGSGA